MHRFDHILVVDDDREIRALLREFLARHELRVSMASNATETWAALAREPVDLIVLDLNLPGEDGLSICRELRTREADPIPVLMLTARSDDMDRIVGLEMGADDYMTKPFVPRELVARIKAILRRARMLPPNLRRSTEVLAYRFGTWELDMRSRHLLDAQGTMVTLTGGEFRLLAVLLEHARQVLTRDQLLGLTQSRNGESFDRSIDLLVSRLRRRLGDDAKEPRYVKTVRNQGYVLSADVAAVRA